MDAAVRSQSCSSCLRTWRGSPRRIARAPARRRHLAAEAGGKHVPWGVAGEGAYTASTKGGFDVIAHCGPLVREATERALAARKTRAPPADRFTSRTSAGPTAARPSRSCETPSRASAPITRLTG